MKEFKKFISRGNALDLAIGVIMGAAFSNIVTSIVDNILTPILGIIIGGIDFTNLSIKVGKSVISYGIFLQNVIDFLIVSFCLFIIVKTINKLTHKEEKEEKKEKKEVVKSDEVKLLEEIRNILKETK